MELYQRIQEVYKDGIIYGVVEGETQISFQSQLFEYRYLSLEAFEKMDKKGSYIVFSSVC